MGNIERLARQIIKTSVPTGPNLERRPRPITQEVKDALKNLVWDEFDTISRRGELNHSVLEQKLDDGEITPEQAKRILLEDDLSYYISELITDFQVAEHDQIRKRWDSMSFSEQRKALDGMTPVPELKRKTYELLKRKKMVS